MGFEPNQHPSWIESVNEFTEQMKNTLEEVKAALVKSKDDMARYYYLAKTNVYLSWILGFVYFCTSFRLVQIYYIFLS